MARRVRQAADEDLVRLYLDDVGRHALITKDDEADLARTIEAGRAARDQLDAPDDARSAPDTRKLLREVRQGDRAAESFVQANLRLVVSIAKRYQASGLPLLDLIQDGNLGLMHAVEKFDWRRGFKFSTYATWWIRQSISRGIATSGRTVRLPVHAGELAARAYRTREELHQRLGRHATIADVATELGVPRERLEDAMRFGLPPRSLAEPMNDGNRELSELVEDRSALSPAEAAVRAVVALEVAAALRGLNPREQEIVRLRFGLDGAGPRTLEEVGVRFAVTRERVRQIEAKALSKLRHPGAGDAMRGLRPE